MIKADLLLEAKKLQLLEEEKNQKLDHEDTILKSRNNYKKLVYNNRPYNLNRKLSQDWKKM